MEEDAEFVYLALERCKQSLNDVLGTGGSSSKSSQAAEFVSTGGQPTELCMRVGALSPIASWQSLGGVLMRRCLMHCVSFGFDRAPQNKLPENSAKK